MRLPLRRTIITRLLVLLVSLTAMNVRAYAQPTATLTPTAVFDCALDTVAMTGHATGANLYNWWQFNYNTLTWADFATFGPGGGIHIFNLHPFSNGNFFRVRASADNGVTWGPFSNEVMFTLAAPDQPGAVSGLSTVIAGQQDIAYSTSRIDTTATSTSWSYTGTGVSFSGSGYSVTADFTNSATSGNIEVTSTNTCGTSIVRTFPVTVNPGPYVSLAITPQINCALAQITFTSTTGNGPAVNAYNYWRMAWPSTTWADLQTVTFNPGLLTATTAENGYYYKVRASTDNGATWGPFSNELMTTTAAPDQPGTISGSANVVAGTNGVSYFSRIDTSSTSSSWTYTGTGVTFNGSGESVTADFSLAATSGDIQLTSTNACGTSTVRIKTITVGPPAPITPILSGTTPLCAGTSGTYTVTNPDPNTATYTWSYTGAGATIVGTGASVTINFSNAATSGSVNVTASNITGNSPSAPFAVTILPLATLSGPLTGPVFVCQNQGAATYTVFGGANIDTYHWSYSGTGVTFAPTTAGGSNTFNIGLNATAGTITVYGSNSCGNSPSASYLVDMRPPLPIPFVISGTNPVCQGQNGVSYSVIDNPVVATYTWSYGGAGGTIAGNNTPAITIGYNAVATSGTITLHETNTCGTTTNTYPVTVIPTAGLTGALSGASVLCQNAGANTYTVTGGTNIDNYHWAYSGTGVTFSNQTVGNSNAFTFGPVATSGTVSVFGSNACGNTPTVTYAVTVTPVTPIVFTINGSPNVCQGQNGVTYSVPSNPNATYNWAYTGSGATISGNNTNSISINFSNTATTGTVTLTESDFCSSTVGTPYNVTVGPLPVLNGPISGTSSLCAGAGATTYTVVGGASIDNYHWSYSGTGVTFSNTTATNTNSLTFTASATSGVLSVFGTNACGTTSAITYPITVNPALPVAFTISGTSPVCQGQNAVSYTVPSNPNVSTYSWSYSGTGTGISGNGTNAITMNFNAAATSGTLTVNETNGCGTTPGTYAITVNPTPTITGPITGAASVCKGAGATSYSIAGGANITTYNWNYSGTGVVYSNTTAGGTNSLNFGASATSGILSVYGTNSCGNTTTITYSITVNPGIPAAFTITGTSPVCQGQNGVTYSVPVNPNVSNYSWVYTGTGATIAGNGTNSITMDFGVAATGGNLTLTESNSCGATPNTFVIGVNPAATLTGPITGAASVCQNDPPVTYTAGGGAGITTYNWSYSGTGVTFTNATASTINAFTFGASATSGIISVYGTGTCGTTPTITYAVTVKAGIPVAFTIDGSPSVCQGQNAVSYSVPANAGVSNYTWVYSGTGASITGNGTNAITMSFGAAATGGNLTLTETNTCGSTNSVFAIAVTPAAVLTGPISGLASVCQGTGPLTYTAAAGAGITAYNWSYSGTGVTFSNITATATNALTFDANATSGILSVFGTGACGTTPTLTYSITVKPAAPVAFTISGTNPICQGQNGVSYSVPANPGVTTYSWTYSGTGASIAGNGTNAITMNFGATATGGSLTLTETNSCGTISNTLVLVVNPAAVLNGPITGAANICRNDPPSIYTVGGGAGIATYNWSYSGTGVTFANTTVANTNTLTFGATATSGILSVYGIGSCGTTSTIAYPVTVSPAAPTAFTISGTTPVCQGQNAVPYSVPANPGVTTYSWVYSGTGATITGNNTNAITIDFSAAATNGTLTLTETNTCGTINNSFPIVVNPAAILNGPVTGVTPICQNAAPVTFVAAGGTGVTTYNWSYSGTGVTFSNATATSNNIFTFGANATSGTVSVYGTGACGTTPTRTYAVTVNPAGPIAFTISGTTPVCQGQNAVPYSVPANAGVTGFAWSYSGTGATITGNNTHAITINFGATATSGTLTLTETNACGTLTNVLPIVVTPTATLAGPISGPASICQNALPATYIAAGGTGVTTYNWSYSGTGVTFSNATATNTNTFTFGATATSGIITVTGTGSCGNTAPLTYSVNVSPSAPVPFIITGNPNVCQGQTAAIYFVPADPNITSYLWTYSGTGATINNNNTNSISIDFNNAATNGTITLLETTACGTQTNTFGVTVAPSPVLIGPVSGLNTVCRNVPPVTYTANGDVNVTQFHWAYSGTGVLFSNTTTLDNNALTFGALATSGTLSVYGTNSCGVTPTLTYPVTVNAAAPTAFTITGSATACAGQNNVTYSAPADPNVTSWTWTYTGSGAVINNNNTNSININFGAAATSGTLTLVKNNSCGTQTNNLAIVVSPLPTLTGPLSGTNPVCQGTGPITYAVGGGNNITSYNWSYNGTGTTFAATTAGNNNGFTFGGAATSGTITVTGSNTCGTTTPLTLPVTVNPSAPVAFTITGTPGVCVGQSAVSYLVPANANVGTYGWSYSGTGATINNGITNNITIDFSLAATSGILTLNEINSCGTTTNTYAINVTPIPAQPAAIAGNTTPCQSGTGNIYSVATVPFATTYTWAYSGIGATITGNGTNIISIDFSNNATSGSLSVTANNVCGISTARTVVLTIQPGAFQPGAFTTGPASLCAGGSANYVIPPVAGTSYSWSYSGSGATILGAPGNAVTVNFANNATSGVLSVVGNNICGISPARTMGITISPLPTQPASFIASQASVCSGQTGVNYSVTPDPNATSYIWGYSGTGATINGTGNAVTIDFANNATAGALSASSVNGCGTSTALTMSIAINPLPVQPGTISGNTTPCQGTNGVGYSVTNDPNITTYNWTYSGTGAALSPAGNAVSINFANNATSGTLSVTGTNGCGTSIARTYAITVSPLPTQPANFTTSTATVCQGQTGIIYTVPNVTGNTYTWTYGGSGVTGLASTTNSATLGFSNVATSGILSVTTTNACGTSTARAMAITVNSAPLVPTAIAGLTTVCVGANNITYSVTADPIATSYTWTYSGAGATITGTGNSVNISFSAIATSGTLSVVANNACGSSPASSQAITITQIPAQPGAIAGTSPVCAGTNGNAYSVVSDPNATSYTWTYSGAGATLTPAFNNVSINFSAVATSGTLSVTATNACGTSVAKTRSITITPLPAQPAAFIQSTPAVCQGQSGVIYTVPNNPAVTYTWTYTVGTGATIVGSGNSVSLNFSNIATSGTLNVTANNICGTSIARSINITVNPLPVQPAAITGATPVCQGQNGVTYSVTNDPTVTYTWAYTGSGASITGNTSSILVNFSNTATSGNMTVTATNACGTSIATILPVVVNPLPAQPSIISGASPVCQGVNGSIYSVVNDPALTYTWTYSGAGATIAPAGNTAAVSYSNVATSGTLTVTGTAVNGCGITTRTKAITINPLPAQPSVISGSATVCQGQNGVTYSVTNDPTVTYTWTYTVGTGATITGTGSTVTLNFSNIATSGTLNVTATNACGTSIARTKAITVNPLPAAPGAIAGTTPVCQGSLANAYSVTNVAGTTYAWTYSGIGATITGNGTNAITIDFANNATSGNLNVTGTTTCGTSAATTLTIAINPLPNQPGVIAGASPVCANTNGHVYSVTNDPSVTYTWTYIGAGATLTPAGNTVSVDFSNVATSGTLSVTATSINGCGVSIARTKAITVNPLPNAPTVPGGLAAVCQGQNGVTYTVTNDPTVTSYTWSYSGTGANITSVGNNASINFSVTATTGDLTVTATNACGTSVASAPLTINVNTLPVAPGAITGTSPVCQGTVAAPYSVLLDPTVTYTWSYSGTGGAIIGNTNAVTMNFTNAATSGNLQVTATNACGISAASTFAVLVNPLPNQPAPFSVSTTSVCAGTTGVVYTIPNDPTVTYTWSYSGGGATINGATNSVTVDFSLAAASGALSVTATNSCGTSIARTMAINVKSLPVTPGTITGVSPICQGQNGVTYSVSNDPTVTYTWTYSGTGATIVGTTNAISMNFGATATTGTLSVTATNGCGTSTASTFAILVNPLPATPGSVTGTSPVCQGNLGVAYSVTNDPTVTYTWTYSGTGITVNNGTTNAITIDFSNTAISGTLNVTATNSCGTSSVSAFPVIVNPLPSQPGPFTASSAVVCQGQNGVTYTVPNVVGNTYTWSYSGAGATITGSGNSVAVAFSNAATNGTLSVIANNACGVSVARTIAITVNPLPITPGTITGLTPVCQGQAGVTYSVPNDPTVTYSWSYSGLNATINGSGNSVTVSFGTTATSGTLNVMAINACGSSVASALPIVVNPLPLQPGIITGSATVCEGQNNVSYSVPNDPTVTNYTWAYSGTGATITGTTSAVTISFAAGATTGILTAVANNACGVSIARSIPVTVNPLPAQPAAFIASSTPVCQGQTGILYQVPNDPTVTYAWTYTGGLGATIIGSGSLVNVDFANTATSGTINVTATNGCGTSMPRALAIVVNPLPGNPAAFTAGPASVCQGQSNVVYTVPAVANAANYTWTYSGTGATFVSVTNSVSVSFSAAATSGILSVVANNSCGSSTAPGTIAITVNPLPLQPANFTSGPATVCQGQNGVAYTVPLVTGATSYTWSFTGTGAPVVSTTNTVIINFSAAATGGTLSVVANNACGISAPRTMSIAVNSLPTQPGLITGTSPVCQGANNVAYSVVSVPGATSYTWSYTGVGATISGTGNAVTVDFSNVATTGNIQVASNNACGTSALRILPITITPIPAQPGAITGITTKCQTTTQVYSVTNVPGTVYAWTYSGSGVNIAGAPANSVTLTFTAAATSGTLSVTGTTVCGTSTAQTVAITVNPLPVTPAAFTIQSNAVCAGQTNVAYQVPLDPTITTYTWTYAGGAGATITPAANNASVNFSAIATSGTIQVTAANGCGVSAPLTAAVTVTQPAAQPGAFTAGPATVCQGQNNVVYTVPNTPGITYTWAYTGVGASIQNSNGNTATISFATNATSGTLSVIAQNNCGTSIARTMIITVNPLPIEPLPFTVSTTVVCQAQNGVVYTVPNDPTVTYTWNFSGTGAALTGVGNTRTLNFNNTATSGSLTVTASNACGVSTAQAIFITVRPLPTAAGAITGISPVCQGEVGVVYSVVYDTTVGYIWAYTGAGATILGTGNIATINFSNIATSGTLSVATTNVCGTSVAQTFPIVVNQLPKVTSSPANVTLCAVGNTTFTVAATGPGLSYQWQVNTGFGFNDILNNATYAGATTTTLQLTGVNASFNGYTYRARVSGTCAPGDSSLAALLTVNSAPSIVGQPANSTICAGGNTSFSASAGGTGLTYQWQLNTGAAWANVPPVAPYSGVNTATLSITAATAGMDGYLYRLIVSGICAPPQTSNAATLNVNALPVITTQPAAGVVACASASADITAAATGAGVTYQWQINNGAGFVNITNLALYSGVTTASLHINTVGLAMNGYQYRLIVNGACATSVTSAVATLTVNAQTQWTGAVNTLWSVPGNWACGVLPTASTVVVIPATAPNMPQVDIPTAICDSLTVDAGASVTFIGTGNVLEIKGSIINNGVFDASLGEVYETGTGVQSIPGGSYAFIRLNGSGNKMISANTTVTSTLVLNTGYMTIGNSDLTVAPAAAITGGSAASFVVTNGTGRLINTNIGSGGKTGSIIYPVGSDNTSYTPLTVNNNGIADDFMVNVLDGIYTSYTNNIPTGTSLTTNAVGKTWVLDEATIGGSDVALTLQWNAPDELTAFDRNACFLSHYIDPFWHPGTTGPAFGSGPYSVSLAGINTFSPFGVGSLGSPLVVSTTHNSGDDIITLYPNPVTGSEIYVKFENAPKGDVVIRILDMLGKVITENKVNTTQFAGGVIPVKIEDLASGAYMMQMVDKNNKPIQAIKFNKQ